MAKYEISVNERFNDAGDPDGYRWRIGYETGVVDEAGYRAIEAAVRKAIGPPLPESKPRLDLDRSDDGSAFIAITYFDATDTPERTSVLSHAYGVVVDSVMKRKFEQMLELMGSNVTSDITNAFKHPADTAVPDVTADSVLVLTIDHRQGYEVSVHRSQGSATSDLIAWVEQFWHQDGPTGDMPDDPDEAIKAYFDFADESYHIVPANIDT